MTSASTTTNLFQRVHTSHRDNVCDLCRCLPFFDPKARGPSWELDGMSLRERRKSPCIFCRFLAHTIDCYSDFFESSFPYLKEETGNLLVQVAVGDSREKQAWYDAAALSLHVPSHLFADPEPTSPSTYWLTYMPDAPIRDWRTRYSYVVITQSKSPDHETSKEGKALVIPPRRRKPKEITGKISYSLIQTWLDICQRRHGNSCREEEGFKRNFLSIRLIDVKRRRVISVRNPVPRYFALSYVFGKTVPRVPYQKLTVSSEDPWPLPPKLPKTVEDAITFTERMGRDFLWVDAYCINQLNKSELQFQMLLMDIIYQCAEMTILANDGLSEDAGLPGISRRIECTAQPTLETAGGGRLTATFVESVWDTQGRAPWDSRAWTLQEGLLSKRCLIFDRYHIRMKCQKEIFHDLMPTDCALRGASLTEARNYFWNNGWTIRLDADEFSFKYWDAFITNYTQRQLTLQEDALNACQGILSYIEQRTGTGFLWAIPSVSMIEALSWKSAQDYAIIRRTDFPSWSWLGWQGGIEYWYWLAGLEDALKDTADVSTANDPSVRAEPHDRQAYQRNPQACVMRRNAAVDPEGRILRIASEVARFQLKMVRAEGEEYTPPGAPRPIIACGDHWTICHAHGDPVNSLAEVDSTDFAESDYLFHTHPDVSKALHKQTPSAEFVLLKYWPVVRENHHEKKRWFYDRVAAILVIRHPDGTAWRASIVMLHLRDWVAAKPKPIVVVLK
ncbi:uncharacterized protein Z518_00217 [Rhinocladiella mackenziei CBS 650.93]|uniref:Heterokaryon incompatibility domain-containing protein n=1 Tax=Rhinocladiella mackenziei CBS 650.93 TaxID=1442369 RepID=A0A0D2ISZ9_9EURO|nr:uncharacterized protein Z518_00217 [Rhinocladiella mackenziei CBS 650.93]KIX09139.1 hypothetical protein Z518_00217 [Rhinocladiella mackenziei CBS 650.93]